MGPPDPPPTYLPLAEADPKPWYRSRGILGALLVLASQLIAPLSLWSVLALIGGALALWGRWRAEQPIAAPWR